MDEHPFTRITPQPPGGPWTFVPLRDGFAAPQRFIAEGESVSLDVEVDADGNGHCRALEVRAPGDEAVTSESLRRVAVGKLTRQAVAAAARPVEGGEVGGGRLLGAILTTRSSEAASFYQRYTEDARRPRRGSPITDENLRQVAELYRAAVDRGDPPTQTVADAMHVARSTAARWVAKARERGRLGAALPGQGGERRENR